MNKITMIPLIDLEIGRTVKDIWAIRAGFENFADFIEDVELDQTANSLLGGCVDLEDKISGMLVVDSTIGSELEVEHKSSTGYALVGFLRKGTGGENYYDVTYTKTYCIDGRPYAEKEQFV